MTTHIAISYIVVREVPGADCIYWDFCNEHWIPHLRGDVCITTDKREADKIMKLCYYDNPKIYQTEREFK